MDSPLSTTDRACNVTTTIIKSREQDCFVILVDSSSVSGKYLYLYEFIYPKKQNKAMQHKAISIRPFIGAENFDLSRSFYRELGFEETVLSPGMSVFKIGTLAFYLQDAHIKDWIDNTMVFIEVEDVDQYWNELLALDLTNKYQGVKLTHVRVHEWGRECFLHDPSGILWHFGQFFNK